MYCSTCHVHESNKGKKVEVMGNGKEVEGKNESGEKREKIKN